MDVPVVANVLGTLGAVCWSIQLIPQIVINYRRHHAIGLQPAMMMLWAWAGVLLGVYNVVSEFNVALQVQPQLLSLLSLVTWIQCYYYQRKWSVWKALSVALPIACVMAGIQAGLIMGLRVAKGRGITWPLTLMSILSALFLALGVLSHYIDIYKHRTVRGISFLFVGIDAAGDIFSLLAVLWQREIDVLGIVIYAVEFTLWCGVFAAGGWYNVRPKVLKWWRAPQQQKKQRGLSGDGGGEENGIALQRMPSSTSVFMTAGTSMELRERRRGNMAEDSSEEVR